jgi:hypothetical protein
MGAREEWYPTPDGFAERVLEMTSRLSEVESDLKDLEGGTVAHEIFPELRLLDAAPSERNGKTDLVNLAALLRMLQLMEDVYVACELETLWNHPLNLGWMNCFSRWATAPTFCQWWPILCPMYGSLFLRFMRERFPHLERGHATSPVKPGNIKIWREQPEEGLAWIWWSTRLNKGAIPAGKTTFTWNLDLPRNGTPFPMQVGLVAVTLEQGRATWDVDDFFIPPSLWNAGIGGPFLRELCDTLASELHVQSCLVTMTELGRKRQLNRAARLELLGNVEFYKNAEFRLEKDSRGKLILVRQLGAPNAAAPS